MTLRFGHPVMRRTPSTDSPDCAANTRNDVPSARAERSAALRRSVHSSTFSAAVVTSDTHGLPFRVGAAGGDRAELAVEVQLLAADDRLHDGDAVVGVAGDVGGDDAAGSVTENVSVHVHNVDDTRHDVNNVVGRVR